MPTGIKITRLLTAAVLVAGTAVAGNGQTSDQAQLAGLPSFADGVEAYIYGYPLVVMAITERVVTTTPNATTMLGRAPINQFAKATTLPNASYTDVVLPSTTTLCLGASEFDCRAYHPAYSQHQEPVLSAANVGRVDERQPGFTRHADWQHRG